MEAAITTAYALSGLAAAGFYLPQILLLSRSAGARRSMSLAAWGGWLCVGAVGVLYAGLVAKDAAFLAVTGLNCACQAVVAGMAAAQRSKDRLAKTPPACNKRTEAAGLREAAPFGNGSDAAAARHL